jgi:hypothetical protein
MRFYVNQCAYPSILNFFLGQVFYLLLGLHHTVFNGLSDGRNVRNTELRGHHTDQNHQKEHMFHLNIMIIVSKGVSFIGTVSYFFYGRGRVY